MKTLLHINFTNRSSLRCYLVGFVFFLLLFTFYTYSQIDLNLTLFSSRSYQSMQHILIQLGYYHRALSTVLFLLAIFIFFLFYRIFMVEARNNTIIPLFWKIVIGVYMILIFTYPAFSHDIFNYLFDARIVTKYGLLPHFFNALDFPNDLWTRFMHWTHRYYPYGPLWLVITIPVSLLGVGKFVWTLLLFKLFFAVIAVGNIWLIGKIAALTVGVDKYHAMTFYAFNPLVMIESVVSPHNDSVMFFFTLVFLFLFLSGKRVYAVLSLVLGAAVKFIPLVYFPVIFMNNKTLKKNTLHIALTIITVIALIPVLYLREPYPWYFISLVGFAAMSQISWLMIVITGLSIGALLRYAPFLYFGDYNLLVKSIQQWALVISVIVSLGIVSMKKLRKL